MKVHDPNLAGSPVNSAGSTGPGKAQQSGRLAPGSRSVTDPLAADSPDQVSLSALSGRLRALSVDSPERLARLDRLAEKVRGGRYEVDAHEVSRRLVDDALKPRE